VTRRSFSAASLLLAASPKAQDLRAMEKRVFALANNQRWAMNVPALIWSDAVAAAAREHSTNMMTRGFFSHQDPERGDLAARLNAGGIRWMRCAENIFREWGYIEPVWTAIVEWMHSPGHKQNLMEAAFTHSGVGIAMSGREEYFMAQIFVVPVVARKRK
jgi:uncharacterized protein YkwD